MCLKRAGIAILYFKKRRLQKFCLLETDLRNSQPVRARNLDLSNFGQTLDIRLKLFCYGRKKQLFKKKRNLYLKFFQVPGVERFCNVVLFRQNDWIHSEMRGGWIQYSSGEDFSKIFWRETQTAQNFQKRWTGPFWGMLPVTKTCHNSYIIYNISRTLSDWQNPFADCAFSVVKLLNRII